MTSFRGASWLYLLCSACIALVLVATATKIAAGLDATGGETGVSSAGSLSKAIDVDASSNIGKSADLTCQGENYTYDPKVACGQIDPATHKIGKNECPCKTAALPGGPPVSGHCYFDPTLKKAECRANPQEVKTGTAPKTDASGNGGAQTPQQPTPAQPAAPQVNNPGGTVPDPLKNAVPTTPTTPPAQNGAQTGPELIPSGGLRPATGLSTSNSISAMANNPTYPGGGGEVQPPSTIGAQPIPTGSNWANLAQFQNTLNGAYYMPAQPIAPSTRVQNTYQVTYQISPQVGYPTQNTFTTQGSTTNVNRTLDYDDFFKIIYGAGQSVTSNINNIYNSLSGLNNAPTDLSTQQIDSGRNPVFDTDITPVDTSLGMATDLPQNPPSLPYTKASDGLLDVEEATAAAHRVQESITELRATVTATAHVSINTTSSQVQATTSVSTPSSKKEDAALAAVEARAANLQNELQAGKEVLQKSNERVRELTAELNALNSRIRAVNEHIADPNLSDNDRSSLLASLIDNILLALTDAEHRLEAATSGTPTPTVGHVAFTGFAGAVSGVVDVTVTISLALSNFIQNIWHALLPAY